MAWNRILPAKNFLVKLSSIRIFERQKSTDHRIQNDACRPNIDHNRLIWLFTIDHLRRSITGGTTGRFESFTIFISIGESKVNDSDGLIIVNQNIFQFKIPVNNFQFMTVLDTADDLIEYLTSFILIHSLLLDDVVKQFSSTKKLHDQEKIFWRLNDLIQLDDIGMTDKFQDVDLSCDSLNVSDVNDFVFLKYFYGDFFTGRNVSCELNFSEGALTESLFYKFKDDMY